MNAPGHDPYTSFTLSFLPYKGALQSLIGGLVVLGFTVWFYFYITAFENGAMAEASAWWPVAMLYNAAGKWPVIVLGVLIGAATFVYSAFDLLKVMRAQKAGAGVANQASLPQGFSQNPQQGYPQSPQQGYPQSPQQGWPPGSPQNPRR
jgi:hypothetical protein